MRRKNNGIGVRRGARPCAPTRMNFYGALLSALLFAASLTVHADLPKQLTFPPLEFTPPESERVTLPNGMKLFLMEDHELPIFNIVAVVRTGDVFDPADKKGVASLTGTVLRTGGTDTRSPDELNETLEFIAGAVESSMDEENGRVTLSVMSKDTDLGLEILADVVMHPAFRQDKFELAKNQLLEGIRRQNDNPNQVASRHIQKLIYGSHPYANYPTVKSVGNITRDDLVAFHKAFYRPGAMSLAVTGDFKRDEIIAKIQKVFEGWNAPAPEVPAMPTVQETGAVGFYHIEKALDQTSIYMGHLGIKRTDPDWFPINVMNYILGGGGFSSRMMREVRSNRGLAYSVGTVFRRKSDLGLFLAVCGTQAPKTTQSVEVMRQLIEDIRKSPVSEAELNLAKDSLINSFIFAYTSNAAVAEQELLLDYYGYPKDFLKTWTDNIRKVTVADVQRVAEQYLHPDKLTIVTVGQQAKFEKPLSEFGKVTEISLADEQ